MKAWEEFIARTLNDIMSSKENIHLRNFRNKSNDYNRKNNFYLINL